MYIVVRELMFGWRKLRWRDKEEIRQGKDGIFSSSCPQTRHVWNKSKRAVEREEGKEKGGGVNGQE